MKNRKIIIAYKAKKQAFADAVNALAVQRLRAMGLM